MRWPIVAALLTGWGMCGAHVGSASEGDGGPGAPIHIGIIEGIPAEPSWPEELPAAVGSFIEPAFAVTRVPAKFTDKGLVADRTNPLLLTARARFAVREGEYQFLLRAHNAARFSIDGETLLETGFLKPNRDAHEVVPPLPVPREPGMPPMPLDHQEQVASIRLAAGVYEFALDAIVGGKGLRADVGEICVSYTRNGEPYRLLSDGDEIPFNVAGWNQYVAEAAARHRARDDQARREAKAAEDAYWENRHRIAREIERARPPSATPARPDAEEGLSIDRLIDARLAEEGLDPAPPVGDFGFLRRLSLDTVGVVPSPAEIDTYFSDPPATRRNNAIRRLLDDPRWADNWVGYWQDVLAENPGLLKPQLNNTGPFRRWIHRSFRDNKAIDRFATELVMMEGSRYAGGPAGFAMATMNDVPMAAKAHVVAKAFLGVEMRCARCHDAPSHPHRQEELFSLAAMLARQPLKVPKTSTIDLAGRVREPMVEMTLLPGTQVTPRWPFEHLVAAEHADLDLIRDATNPREQLAAILTSPRNERFAQVVVNRLWKRYLGIGLVEPVDDWVDARPSHPRLLRYLARELVLNGYDLKHVAGLIFRSATYQRAPIARADRSTGDRFAAAVRRRMSAEQVVDSLFAIAGKPLRTEVLDLAPGGRRSERQFMNLGRPTRAWQFTSLSNDRDRPALALPFAQSIVDVLVILGWRESRQSPITVRDETATLLQPMVLAHGTVGRRVTTLSDDSAFTEMCLSDRDLETLIRDVYLRVLCRHPVESERALFEELLRDGFADRVVAGAEPLTLPSRPGRTAVSWSNHLHPDASRIKLELAELARAGDPPTARLQPGWRERMEDMIWALVNSPEFLFLP